MLPLFLILGLLVSCHSATYGNRAKNKQSLASKQKDDQLIEKQSDTNKILANKEQSQTEEPQPKNKHQKTNETKTTEESQLTSEPSQTEEPKQKNKQQQNNENQTTNESQTINETSQNEEQQTNQNQTTEESQIENEPSQTEESQQQKEPQQQNEEQNEKPQQQNEEQIEKPQQQNEEQIEKPQQQNEKPLQQNEEQIEEPQQQNEEFQQHNKEAQPKIELSQKDKLTPNLELQEKEHIPKAKELKPKKDEQVYIPKPEQESQKIQPENVQQSELQRNQMDKTDFQLSKYYNFKPIKNIYKSPNIKFMPKLQKYIQPRFEQYAKSLSKTNIWTGPLIEESVEPILQRNKIPKFPNYVKPIYKDPPVSNQQLLEPIHSESHTNEIPCSCSSTQRDESNPGNPYNYVRDHYGGHLTSDGDTTNIRQLFDSYVAIQPAYSDRIDPGTDISSPIKEFVDDELPYIYHPENYYQH